MKNIGVGLLAGLIVGSSLSYSSVAWAQTAPTAAAAAVPSEARARSVSASTIKQTVERIGKGYDLTYVVARNLENDLPSWRVAAGKNDPNGLLALGLCNFYGIGGAANRERGEGLIQKAADAGSVDAMAILGVIQLKGDLDHPPQKNNTWLTRAAEQKHPLATYQIASHTAREHWTRGEMEAGNAILASAAAQGDLNAQVELAMSQLGGWMQEIRTKEPLAMLEKAAMAGHIAAMINLAEIYSEGRYVRYDAGRASRWLEAAVATGDSTALMTAARFAERGTLGGQKNVEGAKSFWRKIEQSSEPLASFAIFHRNRQRYMPKDAAFEKEVIERAFDAARRGQPEAYVWVARFLREGTAGHPVDKEKSKAVLQYGVDLFEPNSTLEMGLSERFGVYGASDEVAAMRYVEAAAALRVPQAMSSIARRYSEGRGVPRNPRLAQQCYRAAAGAGDLEAVLIVAKSYLYGEGVEVSSEEAERWAKIAVASGNQDGLFIVFEMCRLGMIPGKSTKDGLPILQEGAQRGSEQCAITLARMLIEGDVVVQDEKTGLDVLESLLRADKQGDIRVALAKYYLGESGIATDYGKSVPLLREAAGAGNRDALYLLAGALAHGEFSLQPNWAQALELYQKAIAVGHDGAIEELGTNYLLGKGTEADPQRAVKLWTDLSGVGSIDATRNLARLYFGEWEKSLKNEAEGLKWAEQCVANNDSRIFGIVARYFMEGGDPAKARQWIDRGIAQNDGGSYNALGDLYREGKGVGQNYEEAVKNYQIAIRAGHRPAAANLAWCFETGNGVETNLEVARHLTRIAERRGPMQPFEREIKSEATTKPG